MVKVITKNVHEKLDKFVFNNEQEQYSQDTKYTEQEKLVNDDKKKTIKKKSDGLIERLDTKIYIAEDNRQLLND